MTLLPIRSTYSYSNHVYVFYILVCFATGGNLCQILGWLYLKLTFIIQKEAIDIPMYTYVYVIKEIMRISENILVNHNLL